MFDMPHLVGENAVIVPASGYTRRRILLQPEYQNAKILITNPTDGVWLKDGILYISSAVVKSETIKICAMQNNSKDFLQVEIQKDAALCDTPPAPLEKKGWKLFYHDEFDAQELDLEHWCPYYLRGWTTDEKSLADYSFRDSCLVISCGENRPPWSSQDSEHRVSGVQTFERKHLHRFGQVCGARNIMDFEGFATQYGYFEIRARFPDTGDGSHFAWWMIGVQDDQNGLETVNEKLYPVGEYSNQTAEYDIIEQSLDRCSKDFDINVWRPVIHPNGSKDVEYLWVSPVKIEKNAAAEFHRYGFEWDKNGTKFYLDGKLVQQTNRTPAYRMMTLFSVYGGCKNGSVGMGTDRGIYPKEVLIDYFRVYKKDEAEQAVSIKINPSNPIRCLKIPEKGKNSFKMSAVVLNQFDCEIYNEPVFWRFSQDISGIKPLSEELQHKQGVLMDSKTGILTVLDSAEDGTELFVTAAHQSGIYATKHIRLSKEKEKAVCLAFETSKINLGVGESVVLKANLFDQYGNMVHKKIHYQVSKDITGNQKNTESEIYLLNENTLLASTKAVVGKKYIMTAHFDNLVCSCIVKIKS